MEIETHSLKLHGDFHSRWLTYSEKQEWVGFLQRFPVEMRDVYFFPDYLYLHEDEANAAAAFIYSEGEKAFLHCFLFSEIPQRKGYFDLSTVYGYGGPISNSDDKEFVRRAYQKFQDEARARNVVAELIRFHPLLNNQDLLLQASNVRLIDTCPTVHVDLQQDEENRWTNIYTHANRKNINKARRHNITISFGRDETLWAGYRELYVETMAANQATGFYYFPEVYYERLKQNMKDQYILAAAHMDGKIISVLLLLLSPVFAHCHRIGTKRELMSLGVNNLLHHEVIQWCKEQGLAKLLIGGGRGNSEDDKLYLFKKNFSDVSGRFFIGESMLNPQLYSELCGEWQLKNPEKPLSERFLKYRF